jgi:hypothetical protein
MAREPTFIGRIGMPGVGKTVANIIQAQKVLYGNPARGVPGRKVLFIDNNNEYRNDSRDIKTFAPNLYIKTIHPSWVSKFSASPYIEACRIVPFADNGQPLTPKEFGTALNTVLHNFRNGFLIAEDFKAYTGNSLNEELIGKLATRRHSGCDTLVSLQGAGMIVPTLWMAMKWLYMHKSLDPLNRSDGKFVGQIEFLSIAENMVNSKYDNGQERFFLKVDLQRGLIYGAYTVADFEEAAKQYIFENWNKTAGKVLNYRDDSGKKMYNDGAALQKTLSRYINYYSQFSPRAQK